MILHDLAFLGWSVDRSDKGSYRVDRRLFKTDERYVFEKVEDLRGSGDWQTDSEGQGGGEKGGK